MLERQQERALQPCRQTRSHHGEEFTDKLVEIADEELVAE